VVNVGGAIDHGDHGDHGLQPVGRLHLAAERKLGALFHEEKTGVVVFFLAALLPAPLSFLHTTSESPAGRPGYPLGATLSLIEELQEHGKTTAGHLLGMNTTDLQGEGASALGGFDLGRDQVALRNYPRGAPVAIKLRDMMERK
jgi:hypothetical protein